MTDKQEISLVARATLKKEQLDNLVAPDANAAVGSLGDIANIARDQALRAVEDWLPTWLAREHPCDECDGECVTTRAFFVEGLLNALHEELLMAGIPRPEGAHQELDYLDGMYQLATGDLEGEV